MIVMDLPFRFDAGRHEYIDLTTGAIYPHITGMLQQTGWIDDTWFTEEHSIRGQAVHRLTADYDFGALDVDGCVSPYRGWLLGHVKAMSILRPSFLAIEEPLVHPVLRFGGRPDRVVLLNQVRGVLEIKSGPFQKSHSIQTALQAILVAPSLDLEPEMLGRTCLYLNDKGKFKVEEHRDRRDIYEAHRIIKDCCR